MDIYNYIGTGKKKSDRPDKYDIELCYWKCGLWSSSISITWELADDANSHAPP